MKYKIIGDINISGSIKGDVIEAEAHAMETYLKNEQVEEYSTKKVKKIVKK